MPRARHILGLLAVSLTCGCNLLLTDWKTSGSGGAGGGGGGAAAGGGGSAGHGGAGGSGSSFCAGKKHAFCESFDDSSYLANWDPSPEIDQGTTLGLVKGVDVSAPSALRVSVPALDVNLQKIATLKKTLPLAAPRAVVELDLDFATPAWNQAQQHNVAFLNLFATGNPANGVILFLGKDTLEVVPANPSGSKFAPQPLPTGSFTHLKLEVDQASSTNTIALYFGDPPELQVSWDYTFDSPPGDSVILTLGLQRFSSATDTTPAFEATYDNVTVDFVP